jgi:thiosulfate reductase cytochrome b subunit
MQMQQMAKQQTALIRKTAREQPWPIRLTHWIAVPSLALMAGSGLQIYMAFPFMGPRGSEYGWFPFERMQLPSWIRVGDWLAGARHVHFACAWLLVGNAFAYFAFLLISGEWRRRSFVPKRDTRSALLTALSYIRLRPAPPREGLYNGLQRAAYTAAVALGAIEMLSGLAIWKPVQLRWLTACFGGYDAARAIHFLGLVALATFVLGHVVLVACHPRTLLNMLTGGRRA